MSFSRRTRGRHLRSDLIHAFLQVEGRTQTSQRINWECQLAMGPSSGNFLHNKPSTHFLCDNCFGEGLLRTLPKLTTRPSRDLHKNGRLLGTLADTQGWPEKRNTQG